MRPAIPHGVTFGQSSQQRVFEFFWKQFRVESSRKYDASILPTVCIQLGDKESSDDDLGTDARCKCDRVSRR